MLNFLDRHLALTGAALLVLDAVLFLGADNLTARNNKLTPLFGSYDAAFVFLVIWLLIAVLGGTLVLLGLTRSHHDAPFKTRRHDA